MEGSQNLNSFEVRQTEKEESLHSPSQLDTSGGSTVEGSRNLNSTVGFY